MSSRFYGVRVGRKTGVFHTWAECQEQTKGFSGAKHKSFASEEEALAYVNLDKDSEPFNMLKNNKIIKHTINRLENFDAITVGDGICSAYVDGSFNKKEERYGWGLVFITDETSDPDKSCGGGTVPELAEMRNVAGEIIGAGKAIEKAIKLGFKEIHVYHDYNGIADWATGNWKANKEYTKRYANFCKESMTQINIVFHWVKGHADNIYNEMADLLAKKGAHIIK